MLGGVQDNTIAAPGAAPSLIALRALGELPDLVTVVTEFGQVAYVSESIRRVLGCAPPRMLGRQVCDFLDARGRLNCTAWLAYAQRGADLPGLVHGLRRADGTFAQVETRIRMIRTDDGPSGILAVSRDMSHQATVESRLHDDGPSRFWHDVIDLVREGVLVLDADAMIVAANRTGGILLGADPAALRGAAVDEFLDLAGGAAGTGPPTVSGVVRNPPAGGRFAVVARRGGRLDARTASMPTDCGGAGQTVLLLEQSARDGSRVVPRAPLEALSPRETAVLRLLADGRDASAIARELQLSIHTVRAHVKGILRKLDARTQLQAVIVAVRSGLLDLS